MALATRSRGTFSREAFSFSVSHDLRAPLGAMDTYCGIIEKELGDKLGESGRRMFKVVREGTQRMERLIEDLLAFALLGRQPLSKQPISVSALVHEVVDDLHKEQFQRRIEVRVQDLPDCFGDPALLKQVFVNLLSNAFKFTRKKEEAVVEVGCEQKTGERIYFVRDNEACSTLPWVMPPRGRASTERRKVTGIWQIWSLFAPIKTCFSEGPAVSRPLTTLEAEERTPPPAKGLPRTRVQYALRGRACRPRNLSPGTCDGADRFARMPGPAWLRRR
jgi:His Kinase A (phospho-acceptor) domain